MLHQGGDSPSTDYYVRPYLQGLGQPVAYRNLDTVRPSLQDLAPGTGVVIVRYLNPAWARFLAAHRAQLTCVAYFMDDDLLHRQAWQGLPRPYVKKLNKYCHARASDIRALASHYWFSTDALRDRYPHLSAELMPARPLLADLAAGSRPLQPLLPNAPLQVFYHGTSAHQTELAWLHPVMSQVLERCPNVHFEVIGGHDVNSRYRSLPRTRVLHPMSWANYQAHCRTLNGHIGLVPLLPSVFNTGRSYVKAYDIARCGAAGLYSAQGPYRQVIQHGHNGLLLDNDPQAWVTELCRLAADPARVDNLRLTAARLLEPLSAEPPTIHTPAGAGTTLILPDGYRPTGSSPDSTETES
ncbi:glycosyltransferase family protein [Bordetella ansorpii]|uniref:hypothetical protein n=1 Tax=Bordetella ansorpii TaxID=288768 RepID=UPI001F2ECFB6|nr:hypothetical protein [Bordetella ansorpii]